MLNFRTVFLGAALAGAALLLPASPALASCEGISNAFAYNECLAKQGPGRSTARAPKAGRGADPESTVRSRTRARYNPSADDRSTSRGVSISRGRNRTSVVIDPWGALKRTFSPSPKKRRR